MVSWEQQVRPSAATLLALIKADDDCQESESFCRACCYPRDSDWED